MSEKTPENQGQGQDFAGQSLKGKKFKKENLANANFSKADLTNAKFLDCDLTGANFDKATLAGARFEDGTFSRVSLNEVVAKRIRTKRQSWEGIVSTGGNFEGAVFQKTSLKDCRFEKCSMTGTAFYGASVTGCAWVDSSLDQLRAPDIKIEDSEFSGVSIKRGDLVSSIMTGTKVTDCDFSETDLSGARLNKTAFTKCKLQQTEMIACDFTDSTFENCDFTKAVIKYSRGLSEEMLAMIKEKGGKVGLDLIRKATNFLFYSNIGRIIVAGLVVFFVVYLGYRTFVPSSWSYEALRAEAAKARQNNDHDAVKKYSAIIIDKYSDRPSRLSTAYIDLGQVFLEETDWKEAETNFQKAYELNKDDLMSFPEVLSGLGEIYINTKKYKEAMKYYNMIREGIKDQGYKNIATHGLVRALHLSGEEDKALTLVNEIIDNNPESTSMVQLLETKVKILQKRKEYDKAIAILKDQIENGPEDIKRSSYMAWAQLERERKNIAEADRILFEMADQFPDARDFVDNANVTKAQNLFGQGQKEEAEKILLETIKNASTPHTRRYAKSSLAMQYLYSQRNTEAEKLFKELMEEIDDSEHDYWNMKINYAMLKRTIGDKEASIKLLDEVIKVKKNDPEYARWAFQERANSHQENGNLSKAMDDLESALNVTKQPEFKNEVMINMVQLASFHGNPEDAIKIAKKYDAEIKDPRQKQRLYDLIGNAYMRTGQADEAMKIYGKLQNDCESDTPCKMKYQVEMINALGNHGELDKAFEEFKELANRDFPPGTVSANCNMVTGTFNNKEGAPALYEKFYTKITESMEKNGQLDNNYYTALNNLAQLQLDKGEEEKGFELYEDVIANSTDAYPRLHSFESLFRYYKRTDNRGGQEKVIEGLQTRIPDDKGKVTADILLAEMLTHDNKIEDAIKLLVKRLDQCGGDMDCCRLLDGIFQRYRTTGERLKMRSLYKKAEEKWTECWVMKDIKTELNLE